MGEKLTAKQEALRVRIQTLHNRINDLKTQLWSAAAECEHVIVSTREPDDEPDDFGSAECAICGEDFGWYCPKSPDHKCKYTEGEWCDYCGDPSERK